MFELERLTPITNASNNGGRYWFYFNQGNDTITTSGYFKSVGLSIGDVILSYNGTSVATYKVTASVANDKTVTEIATDTKAKWGSITGTLSSQTDLSAELAKKFELPTLPTEAGEYGLTVTIAEGVDPVFAWKAAE